MDTYLLSDTLVDIDIHSHVQTVWNIYIKNINKVVLREPRIVYIEWMDTDINNAKMSLTVGTTSDAVRDIFMKELGQNTMIIVDTSNNSIIWK